MKKSSFIPYEPTKGLFNQVMKPLYVSYQQEKIIFAIDIQESHLNSIETVHGGLYMTFLDFAMSIEAGCAQQKITGMPTVNMNIDFLTSAKNTDFIWAECEALKVTRSLVFVQSLVKTKDNVIARASACYKRPRDMDAALGLDVEGFLEHLKLI